MLLIEEHCIKLELWGWIETEPLPHLVIVETGQTATSSTGTANSCHQGRPGRNHLAQALRKTKVHFSCRRMKLC